MVSLISILCLLGSFDEVQTSKKESGAMSDFLFRQTFKVRKIENSRLQLLFDVVPRALEDVPPARGRKRVLRRVLPIPPNRRVRVREEFVLSAFPLQSPSATETTVQSIPSSVSYRL